MTVTFNGYSSITGNTEAILRVMRDARLFDPLPGAETDEYISAVAETLRERCGEAVKITGDTVSERAASLLRAMAQINLINIEEE